MAERSDIRIGRLSDRSAVERCVFVFVFVYAVNECDGCECGERCIVGVLRNGLYTVAAVEGAAGGVAVYHLLSEPDDLDNIPNSAPNAHSPASPPEAERMLHAWLSYHSRVIRVLPLSRLLFIFTCKSVYACIPFLSVYFFI